MRAKELMKKLKALGYVQSYDTTLPNRFTKYGTTIYFGDIVYEDCEFFRVSDKSPIPAGTSIKEMLGLNAIDH